MNTTLFKLYMIPVILVVVMSCKPRSDLNVHWNEDKSLLSIHAQKQKLSAVLDEIQSKTSFTVFVPGGDPDSLVTASFENQPLNAGLDVLIGKHRGYTFDTKEKEFSLVGKEGVKVGRKKPDKTATERKSKPDTAEVFVAKDREKLKGKIDTLLAEKPIGRITKAAPEKVEVPEKKSKTESRSPLEPQQGQFYKLRLRFADDAITIVKVISVKGALRQNEATNRDYLVAFESGNTLLSIATFDDPLILHSYDPNPDAEHKELKAKRATVDVVLPDTFTEREKNSIVVSVYQITKPLPEKITPDTWSKVKPALTQRATFRLAEIIKKQ
ncbi:hypothetical protein KK062_27975 [Fulvivirgaceae bacterium PWU5]|uniref:Uncharacterized protein n=1 Tax=Dawidia cretensis TaxID=2782350 RepID=A0AAP2E549_9BACT|nr:hypothetical protein [Dawidia cretensis]MBT1712112.1 hypothetical protein [Dawidia cretensis]